MSNLDLISKFTSPDNIYMDITLTNYLEEDSKLDQLKFNETRNTYFVARADEYYLSIMRFQVDSYTLPTHFAEIQPNQSNANLMTASFTLEFDNSGSILSTKRVYCNWEPVFTDIPVPPPPSSNPNGLQTNSPYYYSYSFRHIIDIFNTALRDAFGQLQSDPAVAGLLNNSIPPFFVWDDETNRAILYADSGINDGTAGNPARVGYNNYISGINPRINIYMNRASESLLSSLPYIRLPLSNTLGRHFRLKVGYTNQFGLSPTTIPFYNNLEELPISFNPSLVKRQFIRVEQEYSTISNWTPVASVVFTSSTLPINVNSLSAPVILVNKQVIQSANNSNFAPIITDIASNEMVYKPNLLYTPTAQYRLVDLHTNTPINNIDIQVYWKDRFGTLQQFLFGSGATCSIKLAFLKKSLFKNS